MASVCTHIGKLDDTGRGLFGSMYNVVFFTFISLKKNGEKERGRDFSISGGVFVVMHVAVGVGCGQSNYRQDGATPSVYRRSL